MRRRSDSASTLARVRAALSLDGFKREAGAEDTFTCSECGDDYTVRDGCDPSPECDPCAHVVLARARAVLSSSDANPTYLDGPLFLVDGFAASLDHPTRQRHLHKAKRFGSSRRTGGKR